MDHQHSWFSFQAFCTVDHLHAYVTAIPHLYSTHPDVPANEECKLRCLKGKQGESYPSQSPGQCLVTRYEVTEKQALDHVFIWI